ncbi:hypothetical protein AtubIFM57258_007195 [Aspergillus tubingensis]|nr:hypothetical protein AtubIFM57258_007195 [Aspergillus tubingensis]
MPNVGHGTLTLVLSGLPVGRANGYSQKEIDWVCIIFSHRGLDLELLLSRDPFPTDYGLLPPDFMILPVSFLRWQVEGIVEELETLTRNVTGEEAKLHWASQLLDLDAVRRRIFELGEVHLALRRRWLFNQELAANLLRYFDFLECTTSTYESKPSYSEILRRRVQMDEHVCKCLEYELQAVPLKIESQRNMIDSRFNMMIAQSSAECAEEVRRDSASMKTMATMTLIFLPATTISL